MKDHVRKGVSKREGRGKKKIIRLPKKRERGSNGIPVEREREEKECAKSLRGTPKVLILPRKKGNEGRRRKAPITPCRRIGRGAHRYQSCRRRRKKMKDLLLKEGVEFSISSAKEKGEGGVISGGGERERREVNFLSTGRKRSKRRIKFEDLKKGSGDHSRKKRGKEKLPGRGVEILFSI